MNRRNMEIKSVLVFAMLFLQNFGGAENNLPSFLTTIETKLVDSCNSNDRQSKTSFNAYGNPNVNLEASSHTINQTDDERNRTKDVRKSENRQLLVHTLTHIFDTFSGSPQEDEVRGDFLSVRAQMSAEELLLAYVEAMKYGISRSAIKFITMLTSREWNIDISSGCRTAFDQFVVDLKDQKLWPLQMIDAGGTPGSGLLSMNRASFGSYDRCLEISVDINGTMMNGKDCLLGISLQPDLKVDIHNQQAVKDWTSAFAGHYALQQPIVMAFALNENKKEDSNLLEVCVPSLCSSKDMSNIFEAISKKSKIFRVKVLSCEDKDDERWTTLQKCTLAVFASLLLMVCFGTAADYISCRTNDEKRTNQMENSDQMVKKPKGVLAIVNCFSLIKNFDNVYPKSHSPKFPGMYGFKALNMAIVVFGHTYLFLGKEVTYNILDYVRTIRHQMYFYGVTNQLVVVDTTFMISAMLTTLTFLNNREQLKNRYIHLPLFPLYRYLRLMPTMFGAMGLVYLMPLIVRGPVAKFARQKIVGEDMCKQHWWSVALAVKNFQGMRSCLISSWYISVDLQIFVLFMIPLQILIKWPKIGFSLLTVTAVSSLGYSYYWLGEIYSDLSKKAYQHGVLAEYIVEEEHFYTHTHIISYIMGISLGTLIHHYREKRISRVVQAILWCLSIAIIVSVMWGTSFWREYIVSFQMPPKSSYILYNLLKRPLWGFANGWIIYALITKKAGFLGKFFNSRMMDFLGRITLSMLLMQEIVITGRKGCLRNNEIVSHYTRMCDFIVNYVFTVLLSFVFYLVVEGPFNELQKYLFTMILPSTSKPKSMEAEDLKLKDKKTE